MGKNYIFCSPQIWILSIFLCQLVLLVQFLKSGHYDPVLSLFPPSLWKEKDAPCIVYYCVVLYSVSHLLPLVPDLQISSFDLQMLTIDQRGTMFLGRSDSCCIAKTFWSHDILIPNRFLVELWILMLQTSAAWQHLYLCYHGWDFLVTDEECVSDGAGCSEFN
jgi:hypothetical protein